jgi:ribose transport system substrate-binding protein
VFPDTLPAADRVHGPRRRRRAGACLLLAGFTGVVTALAGCSSGTTAASSSSGSSGGGQAKDTKIAFIYDTTDENFAQEMALGAAAAAKVSGISLTNAAPATAVGAQQVSLFDSATQTSKNGIALATLFPDLFVRPLNTAQADGIPLIAVDTPPPAGTKVGLFIGNDNVQLGQALATALLPKIPAGSKGQILIGTDTPGLPVLTARNQGFEQTIHQSRPGITFVNFNSTQVPSSNLAAWQSAVSSHPNAVAYVGPGSQDAASMAQIEQHTGRHYLVGADDLDPTALQGVAKGLITALVSPEHWLKGYIAVDLLARHALTGTKLPAGWWNPGYLVVDSKNIARIEARQASAATRLAWFRKEVSAELADPQKYLKPMSAMGG